MTEQDEEPVFEVGFVCGNCGDEWSHQYPAKTIVREHNSRVLAIDKDSDEFANQDNREVIVCPTCELHRQVEIDSRSPIEDEESDDD